MGRTSGPLAIPESTLRRLARRVGVPIGPTPHDPADEPIYRPTAKDIRLTPRPERTSVRIHILPGSLYARDLAIRHGSRLFVVALESRHRRSGREAAVALRFYRWERRSWARDVTLELARTTRFPQPSPAERLIDVEHDTHFTDSPWPDFTIDGLGLPGWVAVVSRAGGKWHAVPFGGDRHAPLVIDGYTFVEGSVEGFEDDGATEIWYRYAAGRFRVDHRSPEPPCDPQTLEDIAGHVTSFTRSACAYGWRLPSAGAAGSRWSASSRSCRTGRSTRS